MWSVSFHSSYWQAKQSLINWAIFLSASVRHANPITVLTISMKVWISFAQKLTLNTLGQMYLIIFFLASSLSPCTLYKMAIFLRIWEMLTVCISEGIFWSRNPLKFQTFPSWTSIVHRVYVLYLSFIPFWFLIQGRVCILFKCFIFVFS